MIFLNLKNRRKKQIILVIDIWMWFFRVYLSTLAESYQKKFKCNFLYQWIIGFIKKVFYQILLTWWKTYSQEGIKGNKAKEGLTVLIYIMCSKIKHCRWHNDVLRLLWGRVLSLLLTSNQRTVGFNIIFSSQNLIRRAKYGCLWQPIFSPFG